jgi:hypothetical protein
MSLSMSSMSICSANTRRSHVCTFSMHFIFPAHSSESLHIHDCISMSRLSIESLASGCIQCSCDVSEFEASMNYHSDNFPISLKINQISLFLSASGNLIYRRINTFLYMNCHCRMFPEASKNMYWISRKGFADDNNSPSVYSCRGMPSIFTTLVNSRTASRFGESFCGGLFGRDV